MQYIAVGAGWAGWNPDIPAANAPEPYDNAGRLIVLKLDGGAVAVKVAVVRDFKDRVNPMAEG